MTIVQTELQGLRVLQLSVVHPTPGRNIMTVTLLLRCQRPHLTAIVGEPLPTVVHQLKMVQNCRILACSIAILKIGRGWHIVTIHLQAIARPHQLCLSFSFHVYGDPAYVSLKQSRA